MSTQTQATPLPSTEKPINAEKTDPKGEVTLSSVAGLLVIAIIFGLAGGFMDGYTFVAHDHIFSTAVSGDVVSFAFFASARQWSHAWRFLPPIAAMLLGTACARLLGAQTKKHTYQATLICQGLEGTILCLLTLFATRLPGGLVVPLLTFSVALQTTSFSALGPWKFNTAMTTANLQSGTSSLISWLRGRGRQENGGQATVSFSAFAAFFSGALLGSFYTRLDPNHALAPCACLILAGFCLTWRQRVRTLHKDSH